MFIRSQFRHVRDAFKSLTRNGLLTFASITAVSLTLLLFAFATSFLLNMNSVAASIENDVTVKVFIDIAADEAEEKQLEADISKLPEVAKTEYRTKDQELEDVIESQGDAFTLFEGDSNPFQNAIIVSAVSPSDTTKVAEEVEKMSYVSDVNYGGASIDKFFTYVDTARNIGIAILVALLIVATFLISNSVRTAIYARGTEIEIMRLVGAKNSYIRAPFFLEGGIIGFLGAIVPIVLSVSAYYYIYNKGIQFLAGTSLQLLNPMPFLLYLSLVMLAVGILIGSFGSLFSITRFLKK